MQKKMSHLDDTSINFLTSSVPSLQQDRCFAWVRRRHQLCRHSSASACQGAEQALQCETALLNDLSVCNASRWSSQVVVFPFGGTSPAGFITPLMSTPTLGRSRLYFKTAQCADSNTAVVDVGPSPASSMDISAPVSTSAWWRSASLKPPAEPLPSELSSHLDGYIFPTSVHGDGIKFFVTSRTPQQQQQSNNCSNIGILSWAARGTASIFRQEASVLASYWSVGSRESSIWLKRWVSAAHLQLSCEPVVAGLGQWWTAAFAENRPRGREVTWARRVSARLLATPSYDPRWQLFAGTTRIALLPPAHLQPWSVLEVGLSYDSSTQRACSRLWGQWAWRLRSESALTLAPFRPEENRSFHTVTPSVRSDVSTEWPVRIFRRSSVFRTRFVFDARHSSIDNSGVADVTAAPPTASRCLLPRAHVTVPAGIVRGSQLTSPRAPSCLALTDVTGASVELQIPLLGSVDVVLFLNGLWIDRLWRCRSALDTLAVSSPTLWSAGYSFTRRHVGEASAQSRLSRWNIIVPQRMECAAAVFRGGASPAALDRKNWLPLQCSIVWDTEEA